MQLVIILLLMLQNTQQLCLHVLNKKYKNRNQAQQQFEITYKRMITEELIKRSANEQDNNKIYKVDLSNQSLSKISGLKNFPKIRYLQLNFNVLTRLENVDVLADLRELHLAYNQISQIEGLENNKNLTVLDLSNNRIKVYILARHLIKLETLTIDNNCIEKISGLQSLKDLKNLSMNFNKLTAIDSLPIFSKLQSLSAHHNRIQKISSKVFPATKCNKFTRLDLSDNKIKQISFVSSLSGLQHLNLSHNQIATLNTGQTVIKNLEYLNISHNLIQSLPKLHEKFPELTIFLFAHNAIQTEYQIINAISQSNNILQVDFTGNPMFNSQFEQTLHRVYGIDRINSKNFTKKMGARYYQQATLIRQGLNQFYTDIEDDQQCRKIKMSGFFDDEIEAELSGSKPNRAQTSAYKSKAVMNLNYEDFQKSYNDIKANDYKIASLRNQCRQIFSRNGIQIPSSKKIEEEPLQSSSKNIQPVLVTQVNTEKHEEKNDGSKKVLEMKKMNEEQAKKWKDLKNREKSFNIRGVVRRGVSGSHRKTGTLDGSTSKISYQEKGQLMKTQLNPPRWNNDANLIKNIGYRPLSAKKK